MASSSSYPSARTILSEITYRDSQTDDLIHAIRESVDCRWENFNPQLRQIASKVNELAQNHIPSGRSILVNLQNKVRTTQILLQNRCLISLSKRIIAFSEEIDRTEESEVAKRFATIKVGSRMLYKEVITFEAMDLKDNDKQAFLVSKKILDNTKSTIVSRIVSFTSNFTAISSSSNSSLRAS